MATAGVTTIRLGPVAKRRISAAAKRRGISVDKFILEAALLRAKSDPTDTKLADLEAMCARALEAVQEELDCRVADKRWRHHLGHKTRLLTGEEAWRELGL